MFSDGFMEGKFLIMYYRQKKAITQFKCNHMLVFKHIELFKPFLVKHLYFAGVFIWRHWLHH